MKTSVDSPRKKMFPTKEFKVELIRHDLNQTEVAKYLGHKNRSVVCQIVNGLVPTTRSQRTSDFLLKIFDDMKAGTFTSLKDYEV